MAIYNEILAARYARAIQKLFSMKGTASTRQVSGEITPAICFHYGVENRFLEFWNRFSFFGNVTGAAAQFATIRLRNPVGSTVVAVIEKLTLQTGAASDRINVDLSAQTADFTVAPSSTRLDGRQGPAQGATALVASTSNTQGATGASTAGGFQILQNTPYEVIRTHDQQLVISPGDALTISALTAVTQIQIVIWWRERSLEESEQK